MSLGATAPFAQALWGREVFEEVDEASDTVKCTVYDIGGALTSVLSTTCSKKLPMIPHVGVRVYGTEYFYSDVIESRPAPVMAEMLESFPQVSFDLGPPTMTEAELEAWLASASVQESGALWHHRGTHTSHPDPTPRFAAVTAKIYGPGAILAKSGV